MTDASAVGQSELVDCAGTNSGNVCVLALSFFMKPAIMRTFGIKGRNGLLGSWMNSKSIASVCDADEKDACGTVMTATTSPIGDLSSLMVRR